jgi:hypothetical protein
MSPEHVDFEHDVDPGPATLEHILDDLREADIAVSTNPTHDTTHADVGSMNLRGHLTNVSVKVDADELGLDAYTSAWPTPNYENRDDAVTLAIAAQGDGDLYTSTSVEMEPDDARDLAVQLLACAAVVVDDQEDALPGYSAE